VFYSQNYLIVISISTETPMYLSFGNRPYVGSLVILSEKAPSKRRKFEMIYDNSTSPWYKIQLNPLGLFLKFDEDSQNLIIGKDKSILSFSKKCC